jgi:signal transduction histidine kinase
VDITLQKLTHAIGMKVHDNGVAFSVEKQLHAKSGKRLGLLGMRERLEMIGGTFCIESAPGQGTTITAQIPLGKGAAKGRSARAASASPIPRAAQPAKVRAPRVR